MTKTIRTTNKEFKAQVQEHIIHSVLCEEHGETVQEQLMSVIFSFNNWYSDYERKMAPNVYEGFKSWALGLPSCFNVEYEYHEIYSMLKQWFEACGAEYRERSSDKEAELYYHLVMREFDVLCKKHGVPTIASVIY